MLFTKPDYSINPSPRLTATKTLQQETPSPLQFRAQKANTTIIKQFLDHTCWEDLSYTAVYTNGKEARKGIQKSLC